MAFVASIDRQLELQHAGSCMKIGHHSAWHPDAQAPWMDCSLWMKRNKMKERLMCFVFCALEVAIVKTGREPCDHFLVNSHHMCWAGGNQHLIFLWVLHRTQPRYVHSSFFKHISKISPFFQQSFCMSKAFRNYIIPSVRLQTHWHGLHCPDLPFA